MSRVAMLVGEDYEDSEFQVPYDKLREAGHEVVVLGMQHGTAHGKHRRSEIGIRQTAAEVRPEEFDAVVIPGGYGPDKLRMDESMVKFTRQFHDSGKPLAAICHGPQLLIEADVARGHTLTSWPSVRTDLINAGADWVDEEVVQDGNLITSRKPADLDAFCSALMARL